MHGRLKVKTTLEQKEAKDKDRQKKLELYNAGTQRLFQKRAAKEYDEEMLKISADLLSANPDFYTLWNLRREVVMHWREHRPPADVETLLQGELQFLEQCLRVNPKSYGAWHQRGWTLTTLARPDWPRELQLCNTYLEYDERNFHCWDHRRFVVKHCGVADEDEFDFTSNKINSNFSNFSSWHYRSKLLARLHPEPNHPGGVKHAILLKEFELVQNAVFTDPNDQSSWFYHRWLLNAGSDPLEIDIIHVSPTLGRILMTLNKSVKLGKDVDLELRIDGCVQEIQWKSVAQLEYSPLWVCQVDNERLAGATDVSVAITTIAMPPCVNENPVYVRLAKDGTESCYEKHKEHASLVGQSSARKTILGQELESCQQLLELEPDSKWTLMSVVLLLRAVQSNQSQIDACLQKLIIVDPMRKNYYLDLKSSCTIEEVLMRSPGGATSMDLRDSQLTSLSLLHRMVAVTTIDLSCNQLSSIAGIHFLQNVHTVLLSHNHLESCAGLDTLPLLRKLCLAGNALADDGAVRPLASCPSLRLLHLAGNALCSRDDAVFVGNGLRQILGDRVDVDCALVASCARNCVG